ncbi:hypothetical protein PMAYCL1PPCAC_22573, partial [Pristionchus mayeri]
ILPSMGRGIRAKTPENMDEELLRYRERRAKNNESAKKHRERTRQKIDEGLKLKEKYEKLEAELRQSKARVAQVEHENKILIERLSTQQPLSAGKSDNLPVRDNQMHALPTTGYVPQNMASTLSQPLILPDCSISLVNQQQNPAATTSINSIIDNPTIIKPAIETSTPLQFVLLTPQKQMQLLNAFSSIPMNNSKFHFPYQQPLFPQQPVGANLTCLNR